MTSPRHFPWGSGSVFSFKRKPPPGRRASRGVFKVCVDRHRRGRRGLRLSLRALPDQFKPDRRTQSQVESELDVEVPEGLDPAGVPKRSGIKRIEHVVLRHEKDPLLRHLVIDGEEGGESLTLDW